MSGDFGSDGVGMEGVSAIRGEERPVLRRWGLDWNELTRELPPPSTPSYVCKIGGGMSAISFIPLTRILTGISDVAGVASVIDPSSWRHLAESFSCSPWRSSPLLPLPPSPLRPPPPSPPPPLSLSLPPSLPLCLPPSFYRRRDHSYYPIPGVP